MKPQKHIPPVTEEQHRAIAARLGGTPIFYIDGDGTERRAVRLPSGEICADYRTEIVAAMREAIHPTPPQTISISQEAAEHLEEISDGRSLEETLEALIERASLDITTASALDARLDAIERKRADLKERILTISHRRLL